MTSEEVMHRYAELARLIYEHAQILKHGQELLEEYAVPAVADLTEPVRDALIAQ